MFICLPATASEKNPKVWEIAHVWEYEENSRAMNVIAYLMQYLFEKFYFFFSSKKENSQKEQQWGEGREHLKHSFHYRVFL